MTVSTFGTMVFATARFLVLVTSFFDFALALLRFGGFPRMVLAGLRALPRVALPLRAAVRFFRLAMTVTYAGVRPQCRKR
jgi:hypothetical protein